MDINNWRPARGGGELPMDARDWRSQLPPDSRLRVVNEIMDILKKCVPFSGHEGLQELQKIAVRFEEEICASATNQTDYLDKVSLKMLSMEIKSQITMNNSPPSSSGNHSKASASPPDTGSLANQEQILNIPTQACQQLSSENIQNTWAATAKQDYANLASAWPTIGGLPPTMANVVGQNSSLQNIQNVSGISQKSMSNSVGQRVSANIYANTLRQMQGRQRLVPLPQQSQDPQPQHLYQRQQLQQQLMKQKCRQGSIQDTKMQPPLQQQLAQHQLNQILAQSSQLRFSQQSIMQHSVVQPAMVSSFQQNQLVAVQQSTQPVLQKNPQAVVRQQQPSIIHLQQTYVQQQPPISTIMQQNQIVGHQNSIQDMQEQQQLMVQQNNPSDMHQQWQLGPKSYMGALP